jgi:hypothetical protein
LLACPILLACGGTTYDSGGYYRHGPYSGWGYDPYCCRGPGYVVVDRPIIDGPEIDGPEIDRPEAMPLPEPMPEMGMPDFDDMGDMGDFGGFDDF